MCKWSKTRRCWVNIPAEHSYTGRMRLACKPIDSCIAVLVEALNRHGLLTLSSCCGHGHGPGKIELQDGRILLVSYGEAYRYDR